MRQAKKKTLRRHTARRVLERAGFPMTQHVYDEIRHQCRSDNVIHLWNQSIRVRHYWVEVEGVAMVVVWDRSRKEPVTVLTPAMAWRSFWKEYWDADLPWRLHAAQIEFYANQQNGTYDTQRSKATP